MGFKQKTRRKDVKERAGHFAEGFCKLCDPVAASVVTGQCEYIQYP